MPKIPGKKSGDKDAANSNSTRIPLRAVDGTLRELGETDLYLEINKHKILKFRLLVKTQFRDKEGEPVRDSLLKPGDQLSVEVNADDPETGLRVILKRKGTQDEQTAAARPFDHDSAQTPVEADTHSSKATEVAEEPSSPGGGDATGETRDEGRRDTGASADREIPTLARAGNIDRTQPVESAKVENTKPVSPIPPTNDDIIAAARDAADRVNDGLPDFIVQQNTTRYFTRTLPPEWQVLDVVTAEVASVGGKEDYRNIRVNGKPSRRPI